MRTISVRIRGRAWRSTSSIACANFVRDGAWRSTSSIACANFVRDGAWRSTPSIACANFVRDATGPGDLRRGEAVPRPAAGELLALRLVELDLAQPHGGRGDLDALVLAQPLERQVEGQPAMGDEAHE